jgi:2,5-diamino-6-(ribosylamino)-4(3H)-pyrimidinone 5'-phosphate reductase
MLPRVILFNVVSVDGRIDGFEPDLELYYGLASKWDEDATLVGSETILTSEEDVPKETKEDIEPPEKDKDLGSILVIPDSRGRVRTWHALRKWPYWNEFVALISKSTPKDYIDYLEKRKIDYILAGDEKVDLRGALEILNNKYGVETVRVDSGGTLNGVLLREGLVTDLSVLIAPTAIGGTTPQSIYRAEDLVSIDQAVKLELVHLEKMKDGYVWLKYKVDNNSEH